MYLKYGVLQVIELVLIFVLVHGYFEFWTSSLEYIFWVKVLISNALTLFIWYLILLIGSGDHRWFKEYTVGVIDGLLLARFSTLYSPAFSLVSLYDGFIHHQFFKYIALKIDVIIILIAFNYQRFQRSDRVGGTMND